MRFKSFHLTFILLGLAGIQFGYSAVDTLPGRPFYCREVVERLPISAKDPTPYLLAAKCLGEIDSVSQQGSAPIRVRPDLADSVLLSRLPENQNWYLAQLDRMRRYRELTQIFPMSYLAELKHPQNPAIYRELAEVFQMIPNPYQAALALLQLAKLDPGQKDPIQYQLENLIRTAASDIPSIQLLDSLTAHYRHSAPSTAEIMESLCWTFRNYPGAFRNFSALLSLNNPGPQLVFHRVNRFQSLGYFDYGSSLLEKIEWRKLSQPWQSTAKTMYLQIRFQLKDWTAIVETFEVTSGIRPAIRLEEESFILASAQVKIGKPDLALETLKSLETSGSTSPWNFRGRLIKAQAFMSQGKFKDASETLAALKRDPHRQEGTGPILFWQGCLALDQSRFSSADSLMVLASAYTGNDEAQRALEYRFYLMQDTGSSRPLFFKGLPESPQSASDRLLSLEKVLPESALWPFAQLEKAQILVQLGQLERAEAILEVTAQQSSDRLAGLQAEAKAAFLKEKLPGGRQAALARYEDLLIKYQQGVIPEFSRGRIKALK